MFSRIQQIVAQPINYDLLADDQANDEELKSLLIQGTKEHSLILKPFTLINSTKRVYCDISTDQVRPYITKNMRQIFLRATHNLSHPGTNATAKMMAERFVWPNIRRDSREFARNCLNCQRNKVGRHVKTPLVRRKPPEQRFAHLNIDIIGPLPLSNGNRYCLTVIDRFTRWPDAFPIADMTAPVVARALIEGWISRFGVPVTITSDLGRQFESALFKQLMTTLGIQHLKTTSYHPQANGMIERWHRTLKSSILCHGAAKWTSYLPLILLGMRSTLKEDIGFTPAELVYGTTIRLPAEFFIVSKTSISESETVQELRKVMQELRPTDSSWHCTPKVFIHQHLQTCSHIFIRDDSIRPSVTAPYSGPFKVVRRLAKYFIVHRNGKDVKVSVDRIKPAYIANEHI